MKNNKPSKKMVSNIIFGLSIVYAAGVLLKVYLDTRSLPADVCPITSNNSWIYSAIVLLVLSIIITTVLDRKKGKGDSEGTGDD